MKRKIIHLVLLSSLCVSGALLVNAKEANADPLSHKGEAGIEFYGEYEQLVRDPENPEEIVNPGEVTKQDGKLRIDFAPKLQFGPRKVTKTEFVYSAYAQLFHDNIGPRGNFIQVSDYRGTGETGWQLQLRQEQQFTDENTQAELAGATLSFGQSWVNSVHDKSEAPTVQKEVIEISKIGQTYNLAEAVKGNGGGTWSIIFGASPENKNDMSSTIVPRNDDLGKNVISSEYENQQVHENSAVTLTVPNGKGVKKGTYQTVLTWILAELP